MAVGDRSRASDALVQHCERLVARTLVSIYIQPLVAEPERHRPSYWARFN